MKDTNMENFDSILNELQLIEVKIKAKIRANYLEALTIFNSCQRNNIKKYPKYTIEHFNLSSDYIQIPSSGSDFDEGVDLLKYYQIEIFDYVKQENYTGYCEIIATPEVEGTCYKEDFGMEIDVESVDINFLLTVYVLNLEDEYVRQAYSHELFIKDHITKELLSKLIDFFRIDKNHEITFGHKVSYAIKSALTFLFMKRYYVKTPLTSMETITTIITFLKKDLDYEFDR